MKFAYAAKDPKTSRRVKGEMNAERLQDVIRNLKSQNLLPIDVTPVEEKKNLFRGSQLFGRRKVTGKEVAVFSRQLATTLSSGLLLSDALDTISDDSENKYLRGVLQDMKTKIQGGMAFSETLKGHPKVFSVSYVSIVKSGEVSGTLHKTLASLAAFLERIESVKEKVKAATRYPMFIIGFAFFVLIVMVVFLIPKFASLFSEAGAKLPLFTRIIVGISDFVIGNIVWMILASVVAVVAYFYFSRVPKVRYVLDDWKLHVPIIGKEIIRKSLMTRFCRTMGVMLSSGISVPYALEITRDTMDHLPMEQAIDRVRERVISGTTINEELKKEKIFVKLVAKMVGVGEKTGRLPEMLNKTADYYDEEIDITLQNLTSIIEPALIIVVGGIVLIIVIALYLPIFNMAAAIR